MLKFYPNKIKKTFEIFLLHIINGICLAFVTWQTIKCMKNYFDEPQGTTVSLKKTSQVPFPDITVCGSSFNKKGLSFMNMHKQYKYFYFNHTYLKNTCGIR